MNSIFKVSFDKMKIKKEIAFYTSRQECVELSNGNVFQVIVIQILPISSHACDVGKIGEESRQ